MALEDAEIYRRLNMIEVESGRHDERLTTVEDFVKEIRSTVGDMKIQLAVIIAGTTLAIQVIFHYWK